MADDGVVIKISGNPEDFKKAAEQVKQLFGQIGAEGKKSSDVANNAFASFLGNLSANAFTGAVNGIKSAFGSLTSAIGESIKAGEEQENATNALNRALASSGQYTKEASKNFSDYASELQKSSTFTDEVITQNAALIQSFGNLDEQGLQKATKAALDLSTALNIDLGTASTLVGKAAQGNVEALKKYGIQVEDTGDKAKDFATALGKIEEKFGGAAENATKTFGGALAQTKNILGDVYEEFGGIITSSPALVGAIKGVGQVFELLINAIKQNKDSILDFVDGGVTVFIGGVEIAGKALSFFVEGIGYARTAFTLLGTGAIEVFNQILTIIQAAAVPLDGYVKLINAVTGKSLPELGSSLQNVKNSLREFNDEAITDAADFQVAQQSKAKAITDFTATAVEKIQEQVDAQKAADADEKEAFLTKLNDKSVATQEQQAADLEALRAYQEQVVTLTKENLGASESEELQNQTNKLINEGKYDEAKKKLRTANRKAEENDIFYIKKYEEQTQKERLANLQSTLGSIASLQSSGSQELFRIGQAAAIATATIDGIQAIQKAFASAPPPLNFALAAAVGAVQAVNLSKIASAKPPTGAADGALVTDGISGVDNQPFLLAKGEVVAPAKSFDEVVEGTARQRGFTKGGESSQTDALLRQILDKLGPSTTVIIDQAIGSDAYINDLVNKIRDAVEFRGASLGV